MTPSIMRNGEARSSAQPTITPHQQSQLDPVAEDTMGVWMYHNPDNGRATVHTEMVASDGYECRIVTPKAHKEIQAETHERIVSQRHRMRLTTEAKQKLRKAKADGRSATMRLLERIQKHPAHYVRGGRSSSITPQNNNHTMTPGQQRAKDLQDEARREHQAEKHIRELEQEIKRLREGLLEVMDYIEARRDSGPMSGEINAESIWSIANDAL